MPYAFGGRRLDPRMVPTGPVRVRDTGLPVNGLWLPSRGWRDYSPFSNTLAPTAVGIAGSAVGPCAAFNGSSSFAQGSPSPVNFQTNTPFSVLVVMSGYTGTTLAQICGTWQYSASTGWHLELSDVAPGCFELILVNVNGSAAIGATAASSPVNDGKVHPFLVCYDGSGSSSGFSLFLDGTTVPATPNSLNTNPGTLQNSVFSVGHLLGPGGVPEWLPADIGLLAVFGQDVSGQGAGLTSAPFGMLEDATPRLWFPVSSGTTIALYGRSAIKIAAAAPLSGAAALAARGEVAAREKAAAAGLVGLLARGEIATKEKASATGSVALAASTGIATKAQGAAAGDAPLSGRVTIATTARAAPSGAAGLIALLGRAGVAVQGATRLQGTVPLAARTSAVTAMHAAIAPALFLKAWAAIGAKAKGAATLPLALAARASIAAAIRSQPSGSLPLRAFAWVVAKARALLGTGPQVTTDFGDIVVFGPVFDSVAFAATIDTVEF